MNDSMILRGYMAGYLTKEAGPKTDLAKATLKTGQKWVKNLFSAGIPKEEAAAGKAGARLDETLSPSSKEPIKPSPPEGGGSGSAGVPPAGGAEGAAEAAAGSPEGIAKKKYSIFDVLMGKNVRGAVRGQHAGELSETAAKEGITPSSKLSESALKGYQGSEPGSPLKEVGRTAGYWGAAGAGAYGTGKGLGYAFGGSKAGAAGAGAAGAGAGATGAGAGAAGAAGTLPGWPAMDKSNPLAGVYEWIQKNPGTSMGIVALLALLMGGGGMATMGGRR